MTLVSESTSGVTHSGETNTYSHATATSHTPTTGSVASRKRKRSVAGKDEGEKPGLQDQDGQPLLPEDIGRQAAVLLLEEITRVN